MPEILVLKGSQVGWRPQDPSLLSEVVVSSVPGQDWSHVPVRLPGLMMRALARKTSSTIWLFGVFSHGGWIESFCTLPACHVPVTKMHSLLLSKLDSQMIEFASKIIGAHKGSDGLHLVVPKQISISNEWLESIRRKLCSTDEEVAPDHRLGRRLRDELFSFDLQSNMEAMVVPGGPTGLSLSLSSSIRNEDQLLTDVRDVAEELGVICSQITEDDAQASYF